MTIAKKSSLLADEVEKRIVYFEKAHSHTVSMNTIWLSYVRWTEKSFKQPLFLVKKKFWV